MKSGLWVLKSCQSQSPIIPFHRTWDKEMICRNRDRIKGLHACRTIPSLWERQTSTTSLLSSSGSYEKCRCSVPPCGTLDGSERSAISHAVKITNRLACFLSRTDHSGAILEPMIGKDAFSCRIWAPLIRNVGLRDDLEFSVSEAIEQCELRKGIPHRGRTRLYRNVLWPFP